MSKAILMSIQPKWCELIAIGKKTVEVRKTRPSLMKLHPPFKCYIYCTKDVPQKWFDEKKHGKVIGEFMCDDCSRLTKAHYGYIEKQGCISKLKLKAYMGIGTDGELSYSDGCYGWHISDLVIYDEPKELSEFYAPCPYRNPDGTRMNVPCPCDKYDWDYDEETGKFYCTRRITRPPQSWCYVEEISNEP